MSIVSYKQQQDTIERTGNEVKRFVFFNSGCYWFDDHEEITQSPIHSFSA